MKYWDDTISQGKDLKETIRFLANRFPHFALNLKDPALLMKLRGCNDEELEAFEDLATHLTVFYYKELMRREGWFELPRAIYTECRKLSLILGTGCDGSFSSNDPAKSNWSSLFDHEIVLQNAQTGTRMLVSEPYAPDLDAFAAVKKVLEAAKWKVNMDPGMIYFPGRTFHIQFISPKVYKIGRTK